MNLTRLNLKDQHIDFFNLREVKRKVRILPH